MPLDLHGTSASMIPSPSPFGFHTPVTLKPASPSNARHSDSLLCDPECIHSIAISSPLCRNGTFFSGRMMFATKILLYPGNIASLRCLRISRQTCDAQLCKMFCRKYTLAPSPSYQHMNEQSLSGSRLTVDWLRCCEVMLHSLDPAIQIRNVVNDEWQLL